MQRGIVTKYQEQLSRYRTTHEWQEHRQRTFARDGHRCCRCVRTAHDMGQGLHCHHLHYRNVFQEKLCDLMTLCHECHDFVHGRLSPDPADRQRDAWDTCVRDLNEINNLGKRQEPEVPFESSQVTVEMVTPPSDCDPEIAAMLEELSQM